MLSWARRVLAANVAATAPYTLQEQALALLDDNVVDGILPPEERLIKAAVIGFRPVRSQQLRAIEMIEQVQSEVGQVAWRPRIACSSAHLDEKVGRWEAARDLLAGLVRDYPQESAYLGQYIRLPGTRGGPVRAPPLVAALEKLAADDPETTKCVARDLAKKGTPAQAVKLLNGLVRRPVKADQAGPALLAAACLEDLKFLEPARQMLSEFGRGLAAGTLAPGRLFARRRRLGEALQECQAALPAGPPAAVLATAVDALRQAGPRAAAADFRRVRQWFDNIAPDDPAEKLCRLQLAAMLTIQGEYRQAADMYRQLLDESGLSDRQRALAGDNLGYILASQKQQPELALKLIDAAIDVLGPSAEFCDTRGLALLAAGRAPQAVAELREAADATPTGEVFFHLARALAAAGELDAARRALQSARNAHLDAAYLPPAERPQYAELVQKLGPPPARP